MKAFLIVLLIVTLIVMLESCIIEYKQAKLEKRRNHYNERIQYLENCSNERIQYSENQIFDIENGSPDIFDNIKIKE